MICLLCFFFYFYVIWVGDFMDFICFCMSCHVFYLFAIGFGHSKVVHTLLVFEYARSKYKKTTFTIEIQLLLHPAIFSPYEIQ